MKSKATFGDGVKDPGFNVYLITNKENGKSYVGATAGSVMKRWRAHSQSRDVIRSLLHKAISAYGLGAFHVERIASLPTWQAALDAELRLIRKLKTSHPAGYNGFSGRKRLSDEVLVFLNSHPELPSVEFEESLIRDSTEFQAWTKKKVSKKKSAKKKHP